MKGTLVVIDPQKEFVRLEGAVEVLEKIKVLLSDNSYSNVIITKFENSILPGYEIKEPELLVEEGKALVLSHGGYNCIPQSAIDSLQEPFYLVGFDTDACVMSTALHLVESKKEVFVMQDYCHSKLHDEAIKILKRNIKVI